jgi:hypothetical protein
MRRGAMTRFAALCLGTGLLTSSTAAAEEKKEAPAPPRPAAELAQVKLFLGTWRCKGKRVDAQGKERPTRATVRSRLDLGGFWVVSDFRGRLPSGRPLRSVAYWGWDAAAKKLVQHGFNTLGSRVTATSSGWEGDKMVFDTELVTAAGEKAATRSVFTKKGKRRFLFETLRQVGTEWKTVAEHDCRK